MHALKRFAVTIGGVALLIVGVAMMVLPGPGILLIVAGLALLATEYVWARKLLVTARKQAQQVQEAAVASPLRTAGSVVFALALVAVGITMLIVADVNWPALESLLDKLWGPLTGSILIITGCILAATTYMTIRAAKGHPTTYTPQGTALGSRTSGATRLQN